MDAEASTSNTAEDSAASDSNTDIHCALLDGRFFRVVSVSKEGMIKAMCTACPDGKKPLSGAVGSTTNFLHHLKVTSRNNI
jgi:hypothetical protein